MSLFKKRVSDPSVVVDEPAIAAQVAKTAWRATVSLESDTQPVLTWRGEVMAGGAVTAVTRAARAARKHFYNRGARSWVVVVEKILK